MKWAFIIVGILLLLILGVVLVGFSLPVKHVHQAGVRLKAPREKIWDLITGVQNFPTWRKELASVENITDKSWKETDQSGDSITFEFVEVTRAKRLVTKIIDKDLPFGGTWTFVLSEQNGESELTITENGEVYNPIFRFVSRFIIGHGLSINRYLESLKRALTGALFPDKNANSPASLFFMRSLKKKLAGKFAAKFLCYSLNLLTPVDERSDPNSAPEAIP